MGHVCLYIYEAIINFIAEHENTFVVCKNHIILIFKLDFHLHSYFLLLTFTRHSTFTCRNLIRKQMLWIKATLHDHFTSIFILYNSYHQVFVCFFPPKNFCSLISLLMVITLKVGEYLTWFILISFYTIAKTILNLVETS